MPTRILRDWTDSESVNKLSWEAEVFFIRLIMKADDFGRFSANPRLLKSVLFPLKDGLRDADMSRWLAECEKAGLIRVYSSLAGKFFLEIQRFQQRTRSEKSKFDNPPWYDRRMSDKCQPLPDKCQTSASHPRTETETETETKTKEDSSKNEESSCPEPGKTPALGTPKPLGKVFIEFSCVGDSAGKAWGLPEEKLAEWRESFPGIDVAVECRKARQWLIDNPGRRKTKNGMPRFLNAWLSRAQNQGGGEKYGKSENTKRFRNYSDGSRSSKRGMGETGNGDGEGDAYRDITTVVEMPSV